MRVNADATWQLERGAGKGWECAIGISMSKGAVALGGSGEDVAHPRCGRRTLSGGLVASAIKLRP